MKYQKLFDEVQAPESLRRRVESMTQYDRENRHLRVPKAMLVAAVLAVVLAGSAVAAAGGPGSMKEWFALRWEAENERSMTEEQVLLIDSLTQSVGVSDTDSGITVTLDSITVGDSALWMLLTAQGDFDLQGEETAYYVGPEDLVFKEDPDHSSTPGSYGTDYPFIGVAEDGTLTMVMRYSITLVGEDTLLSGGEATLKLRDLMYYDEVLVEGTWSLPFVIEPVEHQEMLLVERAEVPARNHVAGGEDTVEIRDIRVSATGVRFRMAAEDAVTLYPLLDGVVLSGGELCWCNGGGSRWLGEIENSDWGSDYYWEMPVDLAQVTALKFGDTLIPL